MNDSCAVLPMSASKEELSVAYITKIAAAGGSSYDRKVQDYLAIDGSISFHTADLRLQLKATSQEKYDKPSFTYPLEHSWLVKWARNQNPVVLVLFVLTPGTSEWVIHRSEDTILSGVGYWIRVDDIAKNHIMSSEKGLSVQFSQTNRITSKTMGEWDSLIQRSFYGLGGAL